jgi:hypothetical protein
MWFNLYSISCMSYKSYSLWSSINLSYALTTIRETYYFLITIFKCPLHTNVCIIKLINTTETSFLLMSSSVHRYEILSAFISNILLEELTVTDQKKKNSAHFHNQRYLNIFTFSHQLN